MRCKSDYFPWLGRAPVRAAVLLGVPVEACRGSLELSRPKNQECSGMSTLTALLWIDPVLIQAFHFPSEFNYHLLEV